MSYLSTLPPNLIGTPVSGQRSCSKLANTLQSLSASRGMNVLRNADTNDSSSATRWSAELAALSAGTE